MTKPNCNLYTGKWKNRVLTMGYKEWCATANICEGSFHDMKSRFNSFQELLDSVAPKGWQQEHFFLYQAKPTKTSLKL